MSCSQSSRRSSLHCLQTESGLEKSLFFRRTRSRCFWRTFCLYGDSFPSRYSAQVKDLFLKAAIFSRRCPQRVFISVAIQYIYIYLWYYRKEQRPTRARSILLSCQSSSTPGDLRYPRLCKGVVAPVIRVFQTASVSASDSWWRSKYFIFKVTAESHR